jgi:hypothetical protein
MQGRLKTDVILSARRLGYYPDFYLPFYAVQAVAYLARIERHVE